MVDLSDGFVAGVGDLDTRNVGVSDYGPDSAGVRLRDLLVALIVE